MERTPEMDASEMERNARDGTQRAGCNARRAAVHRASGGANRVAEHEYRCNAQRAAVRPGFGWRKPRRRAGIRRWEDARRWAFADSRAHRRALAAASHRWMRLGRCPLRATRLAAAPHGLRALLPTMCCA